MAYSEKPNREGASWLADDALEASGVRVTRGLPPFPPTGLTGVSG